MKLIIDIPEEFEAFFNKDKFANSLERIEIDVSDSIDEDYTIPAVSGRNELALINMLKIAFREAESLEYDRKKDSLTKDKSEVEI